MNIGLVDVDSHNFPNLVLMKLSAWNKSQGHNVELIKPHYVFCGNNLFAPWDKLRSSFEDDLKRIYWLRENGFDPYVMIYDKAHASKKIRHLARWVNNKFVFRVCEKFEDYK